ncbi:hypothetical protein D3C85_465810 [compost metagenome]
MTTLSRTPRIQGRKGSIMTQQTLVNAVTAKAAMTFAIAHIKSLTEEHLAEIVNVMTDENTVKPDGVSNQEFCLSLVMKMSDEEIVRYTDIVKENLAELEAEQAPVEKELPWDKVTAPWSVRAINKLCSLNKPLYISYLKLEEMREVDAATKVRISKTISLLETDEKAWEERHKPFIMKVKNWDDTAPGTPGEAAAKMALSTQKGVAATVNWTGEQLIKLGNAMKRNSQVTGKVVASPLFGIAHLLSKSPKAPKADKSAATTAAPQL